MSPFIDVRHDVAGCDIREALDVITTSGIQGAAKIYCPDPKVAQEDPLVSPILSSMSGTPPLFISAGANEIMYPIIAEFARNVASENSEQDIKFIEYEGMYHSFQLDWSDNCVHCKGIYVTAMDFVLEHTDID